MRKFSEYPRFRRLDGRHPLRRAIPGGQVSYSARRRPGCRVVYFNFALAREMGLIPAPHPDRLTPALDRTLRDTFGLTIINEHDLARGRRFGPHAVLPGRFMATRYLQLQHPRRDGRTSGDGRSIWNGTVRHRGRTWDVTSCGTGVTRLCPATARQGRFFRTGNWSSDYGCGTASIEEGLSAALMSEALHRNGLRTERVLAVIELDDGFSINVRAGENLLRPSHLFLWLKQGDRRRLRAVVDYLVERQIANGAFPATPRGPRRYRRLAVEVARYFARAAAAFESEYVFCWLDWDGDNILVDGGIIDYGSVRQFGLFHREYRFDDGGRWSTTLPEQRRKARALVQTFAQIRDYLIRGRKAPLRSFARDAVLRLFDEEFARAKERLLLRNVGYAPRTVEALLRGARPALRRLQCAHGYFERQRSARGPQRVPDGITWNAIFSGRDLLREFPRRLLDRGEPPEAAEVLELGYSTYARRSDRRPTARRLRQASIWRQSYLELLEHAARVEGRPVPATLAEVAGRAAVINRFDRITGDSSLHAARRLARARRRLGADGVWQVVDRFVRRQTLLPEQIPLPLQRECGALEVERTLVAFDGLLADCRHGL